MRGGQPVLPELKLRLSGYEMLISGNVKSFSVSGWLA
jgi:hypothetical protein